MPKKEKQPQKPVEIPAPDKNLESDPDRIPEWTNPPDEDPEIIPDEDPYEDEPYQVPPPGESP